MKWPLIQYVLLGALRDRLILAFLLVLILGSCLAVFLGSAALIEQDQFTLVFASGGLRVASMTGLVLFIIFFMRRSFDGKDVEFLLSRPVSRVEFILSYAAAFVLIALMLGFFTGLTVLLLSPHMASYGHVLWMASLMAEYVIMAVMALFVSMMLSSAAAASMVCFGFYILARMIGQILGIIYGPAVAHGKSADIMEMAMQMVSVITPRLDLMGQTSWLIYGYEGGIGIGFIILQAFFFGLLVLMAALLDLILRQF